MAACHFLIRARNRRRRLPLGLLRDGTPIEVLGLAQNRFDGQCARKAVCDAQNVVERAHFGEQIGPRTLQQGERDKDVQFVRQIECPRGLYMHIDERAPHTDA